MEVSGGHQGRADKFQGSSLELSGLSPPSHRAMSSVEANFQEILTRVNNYASQLVSYIEARCPGANFGGPKDSHMRQLAEATLRDRGLSGLDPSREVFLSALTARCHDLGRHLQELVHQGFERDDIRVLFRNRSLDHTLRSLLKELTHTASERGSVSGDLDRIHGLAGRRFLEAFGILEGLGFPAESEQRALLDAVEWHNQKFVGLPKGELAWRLCYVIRDHDKEEILTDVSGYLEPEGAVRQLAHFFLLYCPELDSNAVALLRGASTLTKDPDVDRAIDAAQAALRGLPYVGSIRDNDRIPRYISEFLRGTRSIERGLQLEEAIAVFERHESLNTEKGSAVVSYPYYILATVAMLFDIANPKIIERIVNNAGFKARLHYLQSTLPPRDFMRVCSAIDRFLRLRMSSEEA